MPEKYTFNGKEYSDIKDMPNDAQQLLKDENKNGMPDFVENILDNIGTNNTVVKTNIQKFIVKGKEYDNLNQVPEEERKLIEEKLSKFQKQFDNNSSPLNIVNTIDTFSGKKDQLRPTLKPLKQSDTLRIIVFIIAVSGIAWFVYQNFFVK